MTQKEYLTDSKGEIMRFQNGEPVPLEGWDNEPMTREEMRVFFPDEKAKIIADKISAGEKWTLEDLQP